MQHRSLFRMGRKCAKCELVVSDWAKTIENMNSGDCLSVCFDINDSSSWKMSVYPNGISEQQAGFVSITLEHLTGSNKLSSCVFVVYSKRDPSPFNSADVRVACNESASEQTPDLPARFIEHISLKEIETNPNIIHNDTVTFGADVMMLGQVELMENLCPFPLEQGIESKLGENLEALLSEQPDQTKLADIILVAGNTRFYCHRAILSARSPVFLRKFTSRYFNVKAFFHQGEYSVEGTDPYILRHFLRYLYSDCCSGDILRSNAPLLYSLAKKYEVAGLVNICEEYMIETLLPSTASEAYLFATSAGAFRLQQACLATIAFYLNEAVNSKGFSLLDAETYRKLLMLSTLSRDDIVSNVIQLGLVLKQQGEVAKLSEEAELEASKEWVGEKESMTKEPMTKEQQMEVNAEQPPTAAGPEVVEA